MLPYLPGQSVTVTKAPKWSTGVIRAASGRERRTAYWSFPLWQFELQYEVIRHRPTTPELAAMWEFFNVTQGQFGPWLFVDPTACQIATSILLDASGPPLADGSGAFLTDGRGRPPATSSGPATAPPPPSSSPARWAASPSRSTRRSSR